jgi:predicted transposase/invertase (TIGR01784 family)
VKEVHKAMDTLKYMSADRDVRAVADLRQRTINDKNSEMTTAREEGIEEGIAIGIGRKAQQTAITLLSMNLSVEEIAAATGLKVPEVESLRE